MQPNSKFIDFRKSKSQSQHEFAKSIGISRSTIADIERGKIKAGKKVIAKIVEKYPDEVGYFSDKELPQENYTKEGAEVGLKEGVAKINFSYLSKFKNYLTTNHPEYDTFGHDILNVIGISEVVDTMNDSVICNPIFFGVESIKQVTSFKEFKDKGLEAYKEAYKHKEIIHEFGQACRKFVEELKKVKDEIGMEYDFDDWLL